jgi:hypothetical protein
MGIFGCSRIELSAFAAIYYAEAGDKTRVCPAGGLGLQLKH